MSPPESPKVGLLPAVTVVAANMIGTGVFTSLGFQVGGVPQPFAIVLLWLVGGVVALCGAFAYAELSAALPRSGGEYHLLGRVYHPAAGFVAGWISITVGFAAPVAAAAIAMGGYLAPLLVAAGAVAPDRADLVQRAVALAAVTLVSLVHLRTMRVISAFQTAFTLLKIGLILAIIVLGFLLGRAHGADFTPTTGSFGTMLSAPFAVSLVFVMYAYSGWNASTYIAGDLRNPARIIPWSLFIGTGIVIALYVLINTVFLYTTPAAMLDGRIEVGLIAAQRFLGTSGGAIMAGLIAVGLVSAISSMTWAGPRVAMVIGEDMPLLRQLGARSCHGIPYNAIALQWSIAVFLILTSTFEAVLVYLGFTLSLSTFMTVLGVIVLRFTRPDLPRPYRAWGWPFTPLLFLVVTGWMLVFVILDRPAESLYGFATALLGLAVYGLGEWRRRLQI